MAENSTDETAAVAEPAVQVDIIPEIGPVLIRDRLLVINVQVLEPDPKLDLLLAVGTIRILIVSL